MNNEKKGKERDAKMLRKKNISARQLQANRANAQKSIAP
jgi:hypothetical protein